MLEFLCKMMIEAVGDMESGLRRADLGAMIEAARLIRGGVTLIDQAINQSMSDEQLEKVVELLANS